MSSRWISIRASACGCAALIRPWIALISELLPMPRAPHNSALLAGRPAANRSVLSSRMSRTRSIPTSSSSGTPDTCATGRSCCAWASHTKASAAARSASGMVGGARRSTALTRRCNKPVRSGAIRPQAPSLGKSRRQARVWRALDQAAARREARSAAPAPPAPVGTWRPRPAARPARQRCAAARRSPRGRRGSRRYRAAC